MARLIWAIFLGLAALASIAWVGGYLYVGALSCAFGSTGACRISMPWHLTGEDLVLLVLLPGALVCILFAIAWLAHRRAIRAGAGGK